MPSGTWSPARLQSCLVSHLSTSSIVAASGVMTVGMPAASRREAAVASRSAFSQGREIDTAASAPQAATVSASCRG